MTMRPPALNRPALREDRHVAPLSRGIAGVDVVHAHLLNWDSRREFVFPVDEGHKFDPAGIRTLPKIHGRKHARSDDSSLGATL